MGPWLCALSLLGGGTEWHRFVARGAGLRGSLAARMVPNMVPDRNFAKIGTRHNSAHGAVRAELAEPLIERNRRFS